MQQILKWVSEARPDKDLGPAMTHYMVSGGEIRATNGKLTASYPWPDLTANFLVSGQEFEKIIARTDGDESVEVSVQDDQSILVESSKFRASIGTMPVESWAYPGVDDAEWLDVPEGFLEILQSLRAFIGDKPAQEWMGCVALEDGNCYATNSIAIAGMRCDVGDVRALLPSSAIDFLLRRKESLESWAWSDNYVAFRWGSGAWLRSQLVIGKFPEKASVMVRSAYDMEPTQEITDEFRDAFEHVAGLAEDTITIYGDRIESKFKRSHVVAEVPCEVPGANYSGKPWDKEEPHSTWGAGVLTPVISQATRWQPSLWPKPAPFRGDVIAGMVIGRRSE